jgi:CheY-like chemotaxis protein/nitrogen-specific signal transduction histidine kinase
LVHANRQLALAGERMAMLRAVAEEAQKTKATFVAKVSHEFRTPLNMIIGLVSLMIENPQIYSVALSPDMKKDLEIVHRNCEHLARMVNDVLNLTQTETGRLVLHRERFDLQETIASAVTAVQPLLDKKQLYLHQEMPQDLPSVYCDRTRIQQVILNLVSNAARFTEDGGITITVQERGQEVIVAVSDTGPGILPEDQDLIFEPFCQGSTELWRGTGGSGLGLTISKQFIELHGGRIWLESERGVGTTFFFSLPVSGPVAHSARPDRWINEEWVWRQPQSHMSFPDEHYRPRFVIHDATGELCDEFSRTSDEIDFVDTRDISETLNELKVPAHAVVVNAVTTDALLKTVDEIRKESLTTPIIGCSVPTATARTLASGATGYLIKPVSRTDLEEIMQGTERPVERVLIVDDDPDVRSLYTRMLHTYDASLSIETAAGGQDALQALQDHLPDIVFLDVFMPDIDGWQVLAQLRQDSRTADLPVHLLSAHDPWDELPGSGIFVATIGEQISIPRLLRCSEVMSRLLLTPDGGLDQEPAPTLEAVSA